MRVLVFGKNGADLEEEIRELGLQSVQEDPEVVISYGGDGTLLTAELLWPGVPKVALRDSRVCRSCSHHSNAILLKHLAADQLKRSQFIKLEARDQGQTLVALNDIILHNAVINAGVRYQVWIDNERYSQEEIIGDGLVVSTPFGSTAYYRSITHSTFRVGIGLAFNNSTEPINHLVLGEDSEIRVAIKRGPAVLAADNNPNTITLEDGDEIRIRRNPTNAVLLSYDHVRYPADQFIFFDGEEEETAPLA